jgi:transcriptional regulator with XRE-family HTH domain
MSPLATTESPRFADLLNHLFATHLSSRGKPYTLKEVSEGTDGFFSIAYLSLLRRGGIERPGIERVRRLAEFFGVEISYFLGEDPTADMRQAAREAALDQAFADPQVREFALQAASYTLEERTLVLTLLDQVRQLLQQGQARQRTPAGAEDGAERADPAQRLSRTLIRARDALQAATSLAQQAGLSDVEQTLLQQAVSAATVLSERQPARSV